jgi:hypothetical protein
MSELRVLQEERSRSRGRMRHRGARRHNRSSDRTPGSGRWPGSASDIPHGERPELVEANTRSGNLLVTYSIRAEPSKAAAVVGPSWLTHTLVCDRTARPHPSALRSCARKAADSGATSCSTHRCQRTDGDRYTSKSTLFLRAAPLVNTAVTPHRKARRMVEINTSNQVRPSVGRRRYTLALLRHGSVSWGRDMSGLIRISVRGMP